MKTLYLLRHTKAVEHDPDSTDHARSLAKRGINASKALAAYLAARSAAGDLHVDRIFCSTARRTRETYEFIAPALPGAPVAYSDQLYLLTASELMEFIRGLPGTAGGVMIIGHNPTLHAMALGLVGAAAPSQAEAYAALKEKYPTGALCRLQFDVARWRQVELGGGMLTDFVRPSDLDGGKL